MDNTEKKWGLVGFKIALLLFFFMAFASTKTHGTSYADGSYSDWTVDISLYGFIFGVKELDGTISFSLFMFIGFAAYVINIIVSCMCVSQPSKSLHIMSIVTAIISVIGLSPIGINAGIDEYNEIADYASDYISINAKSYILLIILIVFAVVAYRQYKAYCEDIENLEE